MAAVVTYKKGGYVHQVLYLVDIVDLNEIWLYKEFVKVIDKPDWRLFHQPLYEPQLVVLL